MAAHLLIADDDPVYRMLGGEEMEAAGYTVTTVADGREALERIRDEPFDLIITDLEMPHLDGLGLVESVRTMDDEAAATLPIVMVTGRDDTEAIRRAYDAGATTFVQKPVNWLVMQHHVSFVLRAAEASRSLRKARDLALKASRGKDSLMMALRHELRSPLHVIQGFATLLLKQQAQRLDDESQSSLQYIDDGVRDLIDKMDKLFLYSEVLNRTVAIRLDQMSVVTLVERTVQRTRAGRELTTPRIEICDRTSDKSQFWVDGEKVLIGLGHILDNALKFSPPDAVVTVTLEETEDDRILLRVDDCGEGFDLERIATYLSGFGQGDEGLTRSSTGVGLGLTLADYIAHAHGGELRIENNESGGGRVSILLPVSPVMRKESAA